MNNFLIEYFSFMVSKYGHEVRWLGFRVRVDSYLTTGESRYFLLNGHHVNLFNVIFNLLIGHPF
jgi:hypothetical protein